MKESFCEWLAKQRTRNDPIGDLARDAARDPKFPQELRNVREYLLAAGACAGAIDAFDEAAEVYHGRCHAQFKKGSR